MKFINSIKNYNFITLILFIYFLVLLFKTLSFDFSYFDLGLFIDSFKSNEISSRYFLLGFINNLININNYAIIGLFLISLQFISLVITVIVLYKKNTDLALLYLFNANTIYVLFFDFHFEFLLINFILVIFLTNNLIIKIIFIFFLPFIKDIYIFLSIGFLIFYFQNIKKYYFVIIVFSSLFLFLISKNLYLIFDLYENIDFVLIKLLNLFIVLLSIFIIFQKFNLFINKISLILLPYLLFLLVFPLQNLTNIFYHYIHPIVFLILFIYFYSNNNLKLKKNIIFLYFLLNFLLSPLSPIHTLKKTDHNFLEFLNFNNFVILNNLDNHVNKDDILYIQNNFYSPIIANFNLIPLPDSKFLKNNSFLLLNLNKNIFLDDKLIPRNSFFLKKYLKDFDYQIIFKKDLIYLIYIN